jgi:hypothetical protein
LIIKKRFRPDFKKIILDEKLSNEEKIDLMDDECKDIFEEMEDIFMKIDLKSFSSLQNDEELTFSSTLQKKDFMKSKFFPLQGEIKGDLETELKQLVNL